MRHVSFHFTRALALLPLAAALSPATAGAEAAPGATALAAPAIERSANTTPVSASIRYADGSKSDVPVWSDIRITIVRDGERVNDVEPLPKAASASYFSPPKLLALDLDDDTDPEILVDAFTAGFDCCRRSVVFHLDPGAVKYRPQVLEWGDTGYRLDDVIGGTSPEFVSTDGRFPELFRSDDRGPIRVMQLRGGSVRDVSDDAPAQLTRDAKIHRRAWKRVTGRKAGDARPPVAAYVVDLIRLGEVDDARDVLRAAAKAGDLQGSATRFARRIDQRMVAWGYTTQGRLGRIR